MGRAGGAGAERPRRPRGEQGPGERAPRPFAGDDTDRESHLQQQRERPPEPPIPDELEPAMLDREARARLRTLSKDNAERVARHLVAAGMFLDSDPERAYEHAQAAHRRAGRVDIVREAVGLTAYATGRYAEALRELRTARRLSGQDAHRAVEADCERGLGRPERALALADAPEAAQLPLEERVELAIVVSGARLDLGEPDAALAALEAPHVRLVREPGLNQRVAQAKAEVLVELGRGEEAELLLETVGWREPAAQEVEDIVVLDLVDEGGDDLRESGGPEQGEARRADERGAGGPENQGARRSGRRGAVDAEQQGAGDRDA